MIEPNVSIGLILIAKDAGLALEVGSLNRNAPGILVAFLSQFLLRRIGLKSVIVQPVLAGTMLSPN